MERILNLFLHTTIIRSKGDIRHCKIENLKRTSTSERRVAATFPSTQQLNRLREDLSPLTDTVEKLIELHDKEHPNTIIAATTGKDDQDQQQQDQQQPTNAERYHPYL